MRKPNKVLFIFFNGRSNAGGAERMLGYLEDWFISHGFATEIIDEHRLRNTWLGRLYWLLFKMKHFRKRKAIYMARFASVYCWWRKRPDNYFVSNGESTPFFPVDLVFNQGCYHVMEKAYGRTEDTLSRIAKMQMSGVNRAKKVIAITEKVKHDLVMYYHIDPEKIAVVTNRIDTAMFPVLAKNKTNHRTILYTGRLENGKGLQVILQLAVWIERNDRFRLLIACNNSYNTELFASYKQTKLVTGLDLNNINEQAYSKADLVIYPSLYESFGLVPLEALSAGVPVISNPVGIVPFLLQQNFPGIYELPASIDASFLDWCDEIISNFELRIDRHQLHEKIETEFGIASYRTRLDEVLEELLAVEI